MTYSVSLIAHQTTIRGLVLSDIIEYDLLLVNYFVANSIPTQTAKKNNITNEKKCQNA
jgi:hypothetical protein